ncbi:MAG: hypothetical protein WBF84_06980 [Castellaniella sp.]|uniref:hypothetical protein n=1 Tax=Castellaniella sp. TaxID=1955812 RepID=UPI003C758E18
MPTTFCSGLQTAAIETALSTARLGSYQNLVRATTSDASIGAYIWGMELTAAFTPLLSMIEVVLRNNIHDAGVAQFGTVRWVQDVLKNEGDVQFPHKVSADPSLAQRNYRQGVTRFNKRKVWVNGQQILLKNWRSQSEARLDEIMSRLKKAKKPQSPEQIVANTMFGFWHGLLGPSFESAADPLALWPACLQRVFPHAPNMTRATAFQWLENIKGLRNRVFHHEPAWRLANPLTPAGVHTTLTARVREMRELLNAMAPDVNQLLVNTGAYDRLSWLLDPQTISAFAGQQATAPLNMRALTRKVRRVATHAHRGTTAPSPRPDKALALHHSGRTLMTVYPHY